MHARLARFLAITACAGALLGGAAPATSAPARHASVVASVIQSDADAAASAAVELSVLEAAGDFNAVYDRIHPDARGVVPRAAVVGWYANEFAPRAPGVATVTSVRFVEWTWPVTGVTYEDTAEVSFVQPFGGGTTVVEDVVRLVRFEGVWRWFFGRNPEFVREQIERYALAPAPATATLPDMVASDLDFFWGGVFAAANLGYRSPSLVGFASAVRTACGEADVFSGPAFYCPLDETVYFSTAWADAIIVEVGDFAWVTVIAHEWGHHIQTLLGIRKSLEPAGFGEAYGIDVELQADCLSGTYAQDAETRGLLDQGDVTEAVAMSASSGDPAGTVRSDPTAHGSNDQRVTEYVRGYLNGVTDCGLTDLGAAPISAAARTTATSAAPSVVGAPADVLPSARDVPAGLIVVDDVERSLAEVAANYTDPTDAEARFRSWGWRGNAARTFGPDGGDAFGISSVYVSVHLFDGAASARDALDYSVANQASSTGALEVRVRSIGDESRGLSVDTADGVEATVYAREGPFLVRVTVVAAQGDPAGTAEDIAERAVRRARSWSGLG